MAEDGSVSTDPSSDGEASAADQQPEPRNLVAVRGGAGRRGRGSRSKASRAAKRRRAAARDSESSKWTVVDSGGGVLSLPDSDFEEDELVVDGRGGPALVKAREAIFGQLRKANAFTSSHRMLAATTHWLAPSKKSSPEGRRGRFPFILFMRALLLR
jgi:hypothetical protein